MQLADSFLFMAFSLSNTYQLLLKNKNKKILSKPAVLLPQNAVQPVPVVEESRD